GDVDGLQVAVRQIDSGSFHGVDRTSLDRTMAGQCPSYGEGSCSPAPPSGGRARLQRGHGRRPAAPPAADGSAMQCEGDEDRVGDEKACMRSGSSSRSIGVVLDLTGR
ncbi:MAG TPA: hypothetical protein VIL72_06515, partial [Beijerinckiaceae bacterium]